MIKRTWGPIYALVIASLMAPAVALALMAGRVLAAEPQMPDLKSPFESLFEFLDCFIAVGRERRTCLIAVGWERR